MKEYKVLIVEDETLIRVLLKKRLLDYNCKIIGETSSGEEAIDIVKAHNPELIFMDIKLRDELNGIDAVKIISEFSEAVIIFTSALDLADELNKIKLKNKMFFIEKPISREQISRLLENIKNFY